MLDFIDAWQRFKGDDHLTSNQNNWTPVNIAHDILTNHIFLCSNPLCSCVSQVFT
jgi:hypothetical protein